MMLNVPVYNEAGEQVGTESIDAALLGGEVKPALLKQAVVMYHANRRQGHAVTRGRSEVKGSSRKLYRQKGTGRARMGNVRTPIRRGGGMTFAKKVRDFRQAMPRKMRRQARNQAVLAKIQREDALILDGLQLDAPKTRRVAAFFRAVNAERGCVFATNGRDELLYKSSRNIPRTEIRNVHDLNAFDVLSRRKLIFTREAFATFREVVGGVQKASE
jgi:large subunit ribosomal protein L4